MGHAARAAGRTAGFFAVFFWLAPEAALATQEHGGLEGLVVHQAAHLYFAVAMGILIYWLRKRGFTAVAGWRYIQYSALLFILWNLDAFAVHELGEHLGIVVQARQDDWRMAFDAGRGSWLPILYYVLKMDHLLCVPALAFLLAGLRRLAASAEAAAAAREDGP